MKLAAILVAGGVLAGCAVEAPPLGPDASAASPSAGPVAYRPVVDDYVPRRPVEPEDWRDRNRQVAPDGAEQ